ncbi:CDP-glycerol glycerophosphotransferase family protein [Jeotgalibacillus marinus]|uniref:CDP-glycerol glycerophosphotransferase family protein n=1 Tax=Jeotgalibacillus marinus TaxID=86667 RepID=A0ABV3Q4S1_9BACL
MINDVIKTIYLFVFKFVFTVYNFLPLQRKIVMYVTFRQNAYYITKELQKRNDSMQVILICNKASFKRLQHFKDNRIQLISLEDKRQFFKRIYHLATSKIVIVDNYFPFLAVTNFNEKAECIQIWHAAGAIKSFGLEANNTFTRSKNSIKRFHHVYRRFDKILVGSDEMASVFKRAFGLKKDVFLRTGIPRTDLFYSAVEKEEIRASFFRKYPQSIDKKIILYAPTFRDHSDHKINLDIPFIQRELGDEYLFIIKCHPVTKQSVILPDQSNNSFLVIDGTYDVNELLQVADTLITDYSSIPFEYCLLEKPMIFFAYDLDEYKKERGIWTNYEELVPGPVVVDTESLIIKIKEIEHTYSSDRINQFSETWNKYSKGKSAENFVNYLMKKLRY